MSSRNIELRNPTGWGRALHVTGLEHKLDQHTPAIRKRDAESHMIGRNSTTLKAFAALSAMKTTEVRSKRSLILPTATMTCGGAWEQKFSSPRPYEAAHLLAGQLNINGMRIQDFQRLRPASRDYLRALCGMVQHLPPNFNRADSAVEDRIRMSDGTEVMGLKGLYAECSRLILQMARPVSDGAIDVERVVNVFEREWLPRSKKAIDAAITRKQNELGEFTPPSLSDCYNPQQLNEFFARTESELGQKADQLSILQDYGSFCFSLPDPCTVKNALSETATCVSVDSDSRHAGEQSTIES
ncbi:MAG TPA: hypothetical protein VIS96_18030 [Terrimicrobiaceae bacterium]